MKFNIAECRKAAGMTQQQAADGMSVKKRTYASWERGENVINLEQACELCELFGCGINQLCGYEAPPSKKTDALSIDVSGLETGELDEVQKLVDFLRWKRGQ